jgi:hypothetical protein
VLNKTGCLKPFETKIIEKYLTGTSANRIALEYSVASESIYNLLRRNNVQVRTKRQAGAYRTNNVVISADLMDKINGWMLGDGTLTRRKYGNANFGHGSKHSEYANLIMEYFLSEQIQCRVYSTTNKKSPNLFYNVRTTASNQFSELHNKWYFEHKKIVPKDLCLTPTIMKY